MRYNVAASSKKYTNKRELFELQAKMEAYSRSIEVAKDTMIRANMASFGIDVGEDADPQLFLGNLDCDLETLTSAYTVFPNTGARAPAYIINHIADARGEVFLLLGPPDEMQIHHMPMNFKDQDDAQLLLGELGRARRRALGEHRASGDHLDEPGDDQGIVVDHHFPLVEAAAAMETALAAGPAMKVVLNP